ncbi:DUF4249 domain-containing protein [Pontibacter fetidus]|uniref:DUF4249 domain-containing protein n=1 Tax=Pontibacter fetidus TaxID=2700082 RepID=A0A6B2H8L3_9BACT|nr:DUF4249 domain-containing protein [Pontibacter fetidus]NDK55742.1 DUF4249 domain-containing protein [Pontibacter fetidus]
MKKILLYLLAMLMLAFTSCEEVIDYELDTAESRLVVEGLLTDQPGPYKVRLSNTKGYLDEGRTTGVNGALVIISDNHGHTDTLKAAGEGLYQTNTLQGIPGYTYYFKAVVNGKEYTAQSYMPAVSPLDSLTFEYKAAGHMEDEGYYPIVHFGDPAGKGNNYRWNVYINGVLEPDELAVLNDELYDGNYGHANMQFAVQKGDRLRVEVYGIDKPAYDFWFALLNQQNSSGGPFEGTPANAPSNISNGAIGYFGASAVSIIEAEAQ